MTRRNRKKEFAMLAEYTREQSDLVDKISKKYPSLPFITAFIMAGDILSRKQADEWVASGEYGISEAGWNVGSFARVDWFADHYDNHSLGDNWLLRDFPTVWSLSDPDDTDPRFLNLWEKAWKLNGQTYLRDGNPDLDILPDAGMISIYRGQMKADGPLGISWSTSYEVAGKFARGAGLRVRASGVVINGRVKVSNVLGYLTGRGENEIVVNPKDVEVYE